MMPGFRDILAMVGRSLRAPAEGASEILSLGVPREALGTIIALVVVLSVIFAEITARLMGGEMSGPMEAVFANPVAVGAFQLAVLLVTIGAVYGIGRMMGGTGTLEEAALLVAWLQFIMVCLQVVQTVALVLVPPLGALIGIASLVLFLWLLTHFVAVLHGFQSLGQVFAMIVVSIFTLAFVLSVLLALFGIGIQMPAGEA